MSQITTKIEHQPNEDDLLAVADNQIRKLEESVKERHYYLAERVVADLVVTFQALQRLKV